MRLQLSDIGLVALPLKCSSVASTFVLPVGTWLAALIRLQQMTLAIRAAARISRINRRTPRKQSHRIRGSTITLQWAKLGIDIVEVACTVEIATAVAAQVVASRGDDAPTIPSSIVRENAVLQRHGASIHVEDSAAPAFCCRIATDRAVVDRERSR